VRPCRVYVAFGTVCAVLKCPLTEMKERTGRCRAQRRTYGAEEALVMAGAPLERTGPPEVGEMFMRSRREVMTGGGRQKRRARGVVGCSDHNREKRARLHSHLCAAWFFNFLVTTARLRQFLAVNNVRRENKVSEPGEQPSTCVTAPDKMHPFLRLSYSFGH
jgi:hypothetical protein